MIFTPKLHTELGTAHLLENNRAALWAGLGLGKTGMTLSAIVKLFENFETKGVLVIAPLRVGVLTWPAEIRKWNEFQWLEVAQLRTAAGWKKMEQGTAHIYIINWDALPKLCKFLHGKRPHELPFDTIVFDEITKAKSHESKRVNQLRAYINKFKRRWGLTGTPAPNSLLELFAQIRLLDDGMRFGPSFNAFREAFFQPENPFNEFSWILKKGAEEKIYKKCADIALVLRSQDFLDISDTIVHDIEVPFPSSANDFYTELAENLLAVSNGSVVDAVNAGVLTNKLLQVTSGEVYLEQEYNERGAPLPRKTLLIHDAKIKALKTLTTRLNREPVLIACCFRHEQDRITRALPGSIRFDSANSPTSQAALVEKWNKGQIPVLICHPQSAGHGLNLQDGGRIVIWYSYTWSREMYDQLNARVARTGQTRIPEIYRLTCPGTMDDAVIETLETKGDSQSALLEAVKNFRALYLLGK